MNSAVKMLEKTAARFPERVAVQEEGGELTFSGLREIGMSIASALIRLENDLDGQVSTNPKFTQQPIVVYMRKSIAALTVYTGAMYAGHPYVPVDFDMPVSRLQNIVGNIKTGFIFALESDVQRLAGLDPFGMKIVSYESLLAGQPDEKAIAARLDKIIDTDPIYIMFTSGSTGVPKGVTIPHRGIIDYAYWLNDTFDFDENTVLGNQAAFYFDNSTFDIFSMFYRGAKMVIIPEVLFRFPPKIPDYINECGINTIFWVPTVMIAVANSGVLESCQMPDLKKVLFCGEVMPNKQLNIWRKNFPDLLYANLYGPTEITDVCTYYVVDREFADDETLPIGRACRNMRAIVLKNNSLTSDINPQLIETKPGETGELCILGSALARGYWNAAEITRKAFTQNPLCTAYDDRMYHTGDLAYISEEGLIYYVGRLDSQIKLHGHRIELGEIETAAKAMENVENACVIFNAEAQEIVLFLQSKAEITLHTVKKQLLKKVPKYMIPSRLTVMEHLPQTPNGKIDRVFLMKYASAVN